MNPSQQPAPQTPANGSINSSLPQPPMPQGQFAAPQPIMQPSVPPQYQPQPQFPQAPAAAMPAAQATPQQQVSATGTSSVAEDTDRIEKEWVSRAEQIVAATSHSPYQQNLQLSQLKAEYLQKRYGKTLKMAE